MRYSCCRRTPHGRQTSLTTERVLSSHYQFSFIKCNSTNFLFPIKVLDSFSTDPMLSSLLRPRGRLYNRNEYQESSWGGGEGGRSCWLARLAFSEPSLCLLSIKCWVLETHIIGLHGLLQDEFIFISRLPSIISNISIDSRYILLSDTKIAAITS
jgi:hypothetical protein